MASIPGSPLTAEHLSALNNSLDQIKLAQQQIDLAKRAGIDVSGQEATLKQAETQIRQIKSVYYPGQ